jgi:predicted RND superfamily exporter protein
LIILISSGLRFLETPSGYRGFVQDDFKYYQDILELEEKYGNIDVLTYVIKPNNGDIFQKDVLKLIAELTEASWQTPYSSRVSSITNHQFTEVDGDDISIDNFIMNVDELTEENLSNLRELAKKEDSIVNFVMSESTNVGLININLEMPEDIAFKKPIDFAWNQKMIWRRNIQKFLLV